ncbi:MAG: hypothetical protein IT173_07695 [Acidobacteria bacterium]|nr:hypothetical protein [Acidobacteriota bacterium]
MTRLETSYPRNKIKILLLENIADAAVRELEADGDANCEPRKRAEPCGAYRGRRRRPQLDDSYVTSHR